jgi:large subunit ribosomal protein L22
MKSTLRNAKIAPKKANLVAELVRMKPVQDAIDTLRFTQKKAAKILKKVVESAAANAETNFKQKRASLYIKEILVTTGATYKRGIPISRGRTHPIRKTLSHITVKLAANESSVKPEKKEKTIKPKKQPTHGA